MVDLSEKIECEWNVFVRLDATGEVMVKRENDPWIVAKRSDMQELIVTINQKNANLKEIRGRELFELNTKKNKINSFYTI